MKSLLLILISFLFFGFTGNKYKNNLEKENLKGKVKAIKEVCYKAKNKRGMPNKVEFYYWAKYKYDNMGNELLKSTYPAAPPNESETDNDVHRYTYDNNGNIVLTYEDAFFSSDSSVVNDKTFANKFVYEYNYMGMKTEEDNYAANLHLDYKILFEYDNKGNLIQEDSYENGGALSDRKTFRYDDNGNMIEEIYYLPLDSIAFKNIYKYDSAGNQVGIYQYSKGTPIIRLEFKYDDKGNQIEYNRRNENGKLRSSMKTEYEYDNTNNWIKETDYENGKLLFVIYRTIEYYP